MVPRIIHQFWHDPTPPADIDARMNSWGEGHPDWEYVRWNDKSATELILRNFGRDEAVRFLAAELPAMRADIARVAIGVVYGGLFVEANWACGGRLDDFIGRNGTLRYTTSRKSLEPDLMDIKLSNGFFAVAPRSVLFEKTWDRIMYNLVKEKYSLQVSKISGPIMLTKVWKRLSSDERSIYHLISENDLLRYLSRPGTPEYRKKGEHWTKEINRRRIIDIGSGEEAFRRMELDTPAA